MHPEKVDSAWRPELSEMVVRLVRSDEQRRYQQLMRAHHYLGYLPKIGETLWYVATWREQWLALLSFSGSALKCAVRDRWIGWTLRQHYGRLKLVVNNSRFLILPDGHLFNLGLAFSRSVKGVCPGIGKKLSGTAWCCWKPLSIRSAIAGRCTGRRTGCMWGTREDIAGLTGDTRLRRKLQDGVSPTAAARCLPNPVRRDSLSTLSTRRHNHETDGRADAFAPLVFFADFRSPPGPREAPSFVHGAGDRRGGRAVRDARLPGHLGLGAKPGAEIARALWLPSRRGSLCRAQRVRPAQCADPRHPRASAH